MDYDLKFTVKCSSAKEAQKLYDVLTSERDFDGPRSRYKMSLADTKDTIQFNLSADDATALRASLNAITANLQIFEKSLGL